MRQEPQDVVTVPLPYSALERVISVNLFSRCQMSNHTLWAFTMPWNHMRTTIMLYIRNVSLPWTNENLYNSITSRPSERHGREGDDGGGCFFGGVMELWPLPFRSCLAGIPIQPLTRMSRSRYPTKTSAVVAQNSVIEHVDILIEYIDSENNSRDVLEEVAIFAGCSAVS
jgi:hypothetical protein